MTSNYVEVHHECHARRSGLVTAEILRSNIDTRIDVNVRIY